MLRQTITLSISAISIYFTKQELILCLVTFCTIHAISHDYFR